MKEIAAAGGQLQKLPFIGSMDQYKPTCDDEARQVQTECNNHALKPYCESYCQSYLHKECPYVPKACIKSYMMMSLRSLGGGCV